MKKFVKLLTCSLLLGSSLIGCGGNKTSTPKYTVTFKNYDGALLSESVVKKGGTAIYNGVTPTRGDSEEYTYTFTGWDQSLENIVSNCSRFAQFKEEVKPTPKFSVKFKNYDDALLYETTVNSGDTAIYKGPTPTKPETDEYTYTFNSWSESLENIRADLVVVAQYLAEKKTIIPTYTVTFKNYDGSILHVDTVKEGESATYEGVTPARGDTAEYTYTFSNWDISFDNVKSDLVVTAQYSSNPKEYTVSFYSDNDELLYQDIVYYNGSATYRGSTPTKEGTATTYYEFVGWDKDLHNVTSNFSTKPIFESHGIIQEITVNLNNGQASEQVILHYGESYDLGTPSFPGFIFLGWFIDEETAIDSKGTWEYIDVNNVYAKWADNYFAFTVKEDQTLAVSLTEKGKAAKEIIIPSLYNGVTVTSLAANFSKQNTNIEKLFIPGTIETIPENSFLNCTNLKEVTLNEGLIKISNYAFTGSGLRKISIPHTCKEIGNFAFDSNKSLYEVFLPSSVTSMGSYAFDALESYAYICTEYMSIPSNWPTNWSACTKYYGVAEIVEDTDYTYAVISNYGDLSIIITRLSETIKTVQSFTFPSEIDGITDISVGKYLFAGNKYIRNVDFTGVKVILDYAFYTCSNLTTITFSDSLTSIKRFAFESCSKLTGVTFPDSLTLIDEHAFRYCSSLLRIEIPNSVTTINGFAFDACSNVTFIYIPNATATIGSYAFDDCPNSTIYTSWHSASSGWMSTYKGGQPIYYDYDHVGDLEDFNYVVQSYMGDDYVTITSLKASVKTKKNVVIPNEIEGITNIKLASNLFIGYAELISVDLGTGVSVIPTKCFMNCSKLETVILHEGLTVIGERAFNGCSNLKSINMPSTLTTIKGFSFDYCQSLEQILIPLNVATIGSYAFDLNPKLALFIEASAKQPGWESNWATTTGSKQFIYDYVSSGVVDELRYARTSNGIAEQDSIYILGLTKDSNATNIVIPDEIDGITNIKIANNAFDGNTIIKTVDLGNSVTYIGSYSFRSNTSLRSVIIPSSCVTVKSNAFSGLNSACVINCAASEKPAGWDSKWTDGSAGTVNWGYNR